MLGPGGNGKSIQASLPYICVWVCRVLREACGHSNGTLSVRRPFILEGTKGTRPASRGTSPEIPSSRTGARSLIICISFAVTLHLIHEINGRHRLLFHPPPSPTSSTFSSMRCLQQLGSNRRRNDPCLDTRCQRQDQDVPHARFAADSRAAGASWRAHATLQHASTLRMRQADTGIRTQALRGSGGLSSLSPARATARGDNRRVLHRLWPGAAYLTRALRNCAGPGATVPVLSRARGGSSPHVIHRRWPRVPCLWAQHGYQRP